MPPKPDIVLVPDAGPLITLAYAEALDVLFRPGWSVGVVDMVLVEVIRHATPTSEKLARWAEDGQVLHFETEICRSYRTAQAQFPGAAKRSHLGELAIQETMNDFALAQPPKTGVFLFEDHKIARASFLLPENCRKVSTRAFLLFLEGEGWIDSAADIERRAIQAGRAFSTLRFPPP